MAAQLIPFAGKDRHERPLWMREALDPDEFAHVLAAFRAGQNTVRIARDLACSEAAAANALAVARDEERRGRAMG